MSLKTLIDTIQLIKFIIVRISVHFKLFYYTFSTNNWLKAAERLNYSWSAGSILCFIFCSVFLLTHPAFDAGKTEIKCLKN